MRTREELMEATFKCMHRMGDLTPTHVSIPLRTGGTLEKDIYKVAP